MANLTARAKIASAAATSKVLAFFDSAEFRDGLKICCPEAAQMTSKDLLEHLRKEIQISELAHSFPIMSGDTWAQDITVDLAKKYNWFLNEWQAPLITGENTSKFDDYSLAEVGIFGCRSFAHEIPTLAEASDRLIYIAQNLRQSDFGSLPTFGNVTAIFSTEYVKDMVAVAPVDTGLFEFSCNPKLNSSGKFHGVKYRCGVWDKVVGTLDYLDHVILPNFDMQPNSSRVKEAIEFFQRSAFAGNYSKLPPLTAKSAMKYYESNLLGNPWFPDGVKFLIGNFPELIGTDDISRVQDLANQYSWPLMWALGMAGADPHSMTTSFPGNGRILDPTAKVTEHLNVSLPSGASATFKKIQQEAASARKLGNLTAQQITSWWSRLKVSTIEMAPLVSRSCASAACLGTNLWTGTCVCKVHGIEEADFVV